jgi:hypothetical protein
MGFILAWQAGRGYSGILLPRQGFIGYVAFFSPFSGGFNGGKMARRE